MTLAFALRGSNGLVMGADSRVTGPAGTADTSTKFLKVNREVGILTYGAAEIGHDTINHIVDKVNNYGHFENRKRTVYFSEIQEITEKVFRDTFNKKLQSLNEKLREKGDSEIDSFHPTLLTGIVLGGYDANETNQFKIVHLNSSNFEVESRADIVAAQWHISQFLSDHFYYSEMDIEQLKRLAVFMLIETETVSATVGGQLKLATVTLEQGFQLLHEKDIQNIIRENQPRFAKYRRILLDNLRSL